MFVHTWRRPALVDGLLFSFRMDEVACSERRGARGPCSEGAVAARDVDGRAVIVAGLREGLAILDVSEGWSSAAHGRPTREFERGEMGESVPR